MNAILRYINESVAELRQVRWPTRNQAIRLSIIVIGFCVVAALVFGVVDAVLSEIINFLVSLAA